MKKAGIAGVCIAIVVLATLATLRNSHGPRLNTECLQNRMMLTVIVHPTPADVQREYEKYDDRPERPAGRQGFALHKDNSDWREIHVPALRGQTDRERIETWGHELAHAVCGKWHD